MKRMLFWLLCVALVMPVSALAQARPLLFAELPQAPQPQTPATQTPAQPPPIPATAPAPNAQTSPKAESSDDQFKNEEKQRMLGVVPAFNTVESGNAPPLRPSQKFSLFFKGAIDPFIFATAAIDAGIEQAQGTYPEYHQGAEGYFKRFGASYADTVDGNFWGNAVLPVLLHQDPRYFRLGRGSFKRRLWYSVVSTVRCKGDNGKWQPNYSNIGGNLIGGSFSNLYYPASDRGIGLTLERGFVVSAEGAIGSFAFEFYPDAISYLKRHHHRQTVVAAPAATPAQP